MSSGFRSSVWDPLLILSQIVSLQCFYYLSIGLWITFFDLVFGYSPSLDHIFADNLLTFKGTHGRVLQIAFLFNSLTSSLGLWIIVKRTKQCLDFAGTIHVYHLIICWVYNSHFPHTFVWWLVCIISTILMTVLGEFLCMRSELKAIPLGPKANL